MRVMPLESNWRHIEADVKENFCQSVWIDSCEGLSLCTCRSIKSKHHQLGLYAHC